MAKEPSKREGGIFGGKGSLKEDLQDISGDKKITFADTWLGDLLGFDGKAGVQGANLKESWYGARRRPYRERAKEVPSLERAAKKWVESRQQREEAQESLRRSFDDKAAATDRAVRSMSRERFPFFEEVPPVKRAAATETTDTPSKITTINEMGGLKDGIKTLEERQSIVELSNQYDLTTGDRPYFTSIEELQKALKAKLISPGEVVFIEGTGGYRVPTTPKKGLMEKPATTPETKQEVTPKPELAKAWDYNELSKIEAYEAIEADILNGRIPEPVRLGHIRSQYQKEGAGLGGGQWTDLENLLKETMGNN